MSSSDDIKYNGKLYITIHRARSLFSVSFLEMDPYCMIYLGKEHFKSHIAKHGGAKPVWEQQFLFNVDGVKGNEILRIKVKNKELITDDEIGEFSLALAKIIDHLGKKWLKIVDTKDYTAIHGEIEVSFDWEGTPAGKRNDGLKDEKHDIISPNPQPNSHTLNSSANFTSIQSQPTSQIPSQPSVAFIGQPVASYSTGIVTSYIQTQPFVIVDKLTGYTLQPYGSGQHETPLVWTRNIQSNQNQFVVDNVGLLKHVASGLYVHPKQGLLALNTPLVLANGIANTARFIPESGFVHGNSGLYLSSPAGQSIGSFEPTIAALGTQQQIQFVPLQISPPTIISPPPTKNTSPFYIITGSGELVQPNESSELSLISSSNRCKQAQFVWRENNIQHLNSSLYIQAKFNPITQQQHNEKLNTKLYIDAVNSKDSFPLQFTYYGGYLIIPNTTYGVSSRAGKSLWLDSLSDNYLRVGLEEASCNDASGEAEFKNGTEKFALYIAASNEYLIAEDSIQHNGKVAKLAKDYHYENIFRFDGPQLVHNSSKTVMQPLGKAVEGVLLGFVPIPTPDNDNDPMLRLFEHLDDGRIQHFSTELYVAVQRDGTGAKLVLHKHSNDKFQEKPA